MPRSLWNGTIAFATIGVPVKLYSATESKSVRFHERHVSDGAPIEYRRVCEQEHREVPYGEITKGFEAKDGALVTLSREEIASADGPAEHVVQIEHFAHTEEIDPIYFERAYYLGPGRFGADAYRLVHAALKRSQRVGIGHFVFHNRERLVAIRALPDILAMQSMRFADELASAEELDVHPPREHPSTREMNAARALIEQLSERFEPEREKDSYREAVLALIERKARGEAIAPAVPTVPATSDRDLLSALQRSIEGHATRRRHRAPAGDPRGTSTERPPKPSSASPREGGRTGERR